MRSHLKQYYPATLAAFAVGGVGLDSREARAVLAVGAGPATAARTTRAQFRAALRRPGRRRNIEVWAERLRTVFTGDYLHQQPLVEQAMGLGFGSGSACWPRRAEWQDAGVWDELQRVLLDRLRAADRLDFS